MVAVETAAQKFQKKEPAFFVSINLNAGPYISNTSATSDIINPVFTNDKKVDSYYEFGLQIQSKKGPVISFQRNVTDVSLDKERLAGDYDLANPPFTVQVGDTTPHFELKYFKLGAGWRFELNPRNIITSTAHFNYGIYKLRSGVLAYREVGTNRFFNRSFDSERNSLMGYSIALNYRHHSIRDFEEPRLTRFIGLGVEYSHLSSSGNGNFTDFRFYQQDIRSSYSFDKKFNLIYFYVCVGFSLDCPDMNRKILKER
jgi:hypothetical protein